MDLPVRERLRIVGTLVRSVDPEEDDDAAEAWVAERDRRSAAVATEPRNSSTRPPLTHATLSKRDVLSQVKVRCRDHGNGMRSAAEWRPC